MSALLRNEVEMVAKLLGGRVVFVGAIAVLGYLGWKYRSTRDIDMALTSGTTLEYLERRGFRLVKETLYSPGGFKVDVYTEDVNGVPRALSAIKNCSPLYSSTKSSRRRSETVKRPYLLRRWSEAIGTIRISESRKSFHIP